MIRPLRRRHDALFVILALALPALFASALAARPDPTSLFHDIPASLYRAPRTDIASETADVPGGRWLDVAFGQLPNRPALLLYWVPKLSVAPSAESVLAGGARLLGAPRAHSTARYQFPAPAKDNPGALVLYSLGHQSVVGDAVILDAKALNSTVQVGEHANENVDP